MLPIYIPSKARHTLANVNDGPMSWLPKDAAVTYIVPAEEVRLYSELNLGDNVDIVPEPAQVKNIAQARWFAGYLAGQRGQEAFTMMDDDIRLLVRERPDHFRLRNATEQDARDLFEAITFYMSQGVGHLGVSPRQGNNRAGVGLPHQLIAYNTRIMQLLSYKTDAFLSAEHGRITVMEDFDVTLQLLRKGIPNLCFYHWAVGQKMTNSPGGCSTYRTHEVHDASARALAEFHPGFVRLRQKQNKTDRENFGSRTEVTISWKKAFQSSQRNTNDAS